MGRHRRSAAGRAATGRATGVTHTDGSPTRSHDPLDSYPDDRPTMGIAPYLNPEAYAEAYAQSDAYLFATDEGYDRTPHPSTAPPRARPPRSSAVTASVPTPAPGRPGAARTGAARRRPWRR
jgi:hypothetical protein